MKQINLDNGDDDSLIVTISNHDILPNGRYMFVEFYCTDPLCDCNSGAFQMIELDSKGNETQHTIALMDYTWNEPISAQNPILSPQFVGSGLAEAGLDEFKKLLVNDSNTLIMIKEAYASTRQDFRDNPRKYAQVSSTITNNDKIGRNQHCPCGSGKKYKKCCLSW